MSLISLDYDKTFTVDPPLWREFVKMATARGHQVVCVKMRHSSEPVEDFPGEVVYTTRKAKGPFMQNAGRPVDLWIDDSPGWIGMDSQ